MNLLEYVICYKHKYFTKEMYSRIQRIQFSIDSFTNIFFLTTFIILSDTKNLKQKKNKILVV